MHLVHDTNVAQVSLETCWQSSSYAAVPSARLLILSGAAKQPSNRWRLSDTTVKRRRSLPGILSSVPEHVSYTSCDSSLGPFLHHSIEYTKPLLAEQSLSVAHHEFHCESSYNPDKSYVGSFHTSVFMLFTLDIRGPGCK